MAKGGKKNNKKKNNNNANNKQPPINNNPPPGLEEPAPEKAVEPAGNAEAPVCKTSQV